MEMEVLHSIILGSGRPLLILHGFLGMSDNWKTMGLLYAQKGIEVHLIDQRNHGKSFRSEDFSYELLSRDLERYMAYHKISKAIVLGHSMGGKTAMQFACDHPDLVEKLIVADIAPKYYPPHHNYILDALNKLDLDRITSRTEADSELGKHITDFGIRQFLLKNLYWNENKKLAFRFNLSALSSKIETIGDTIGNTSSYHGPVLFLSGEKSEYVSFEDLPEIKRHFPKAIIETIEKAGHWLHAENPEQFFEKTIFFINS